MPQSSSLDRPAPRTIRRRCRCPAVFRMRLKLLCGEGAGKACNGVYLLLAPEKRPKWHLQRLVLVKDRKTRCYTPTGRRCAEAPPSPRLTHTTTPPTHPPARTGCKRVREFILETQISTRADRAPDFSSLFNTDKNSALFQPGPPPPPDPTSQDTWPKRSSAPDPWAHTTPAAAAPRPELLSTRSKSSQSLLGAARFPAARRRARVTARLARASTAASSSGEGSHRRAKAAPSSGREAPISRMRRRT